jgi:hypothetical protein
MTNPVKGEVSFESGGKTYYFKLGTNAQVLLEKKTGMPMSKYLKQDRIEDMGAADIRLIFWAGLTRNHPDLTEDMVGDLIDDVGADRIGEIFVEAFESAKVKKDNGADEGALPPKPVKARIGMNS